MTAAMNRALDLYPAPDNWEVRGPASDHGLPANLKRDMSDADRKRVARQTMLRMSLIADDNWPMMIRAFRTVMQREIAPSPRALTAEEKMLHSNMIFSELGEFNEASDLIGQIDGLLDVLYVTLGALVHMGLTDHQILAGFAEVQASNMTKVQDDGTPLINDGKINPHEPIGKVLKTHNYVRPNLAEAMSLEPSP